MGRVSRPLGQVVHPWTATVRWAGWNHILCTESLKMAIMAKTCVCPGFACFIGNLVTSSSAYSTKNVDVRGCAEMGGGRSRGRGGGGFPLKQQGQCCGCTLTSAL